MKFYISILFIISLGANVSAKEYSFNDKVFFFKKVNNEYEILLNEVPEAEKQNVENTLTNLFTIISKTPNYTEYKKYLLKMNSILIMKSTFISDNEDKLIKNLKQSLPISLCTTYVFKEYSTTAINELTNFIIYNKERSSGLKNSFKYYNKPEIFKKSKTVIDKIKHKIKEYCK